MLNHTKHLDDYLNKYKNIQVYKYFFNHGYLKIGENQINLIKNDINNMINNNFDINMPYDDYKYNLLQIFVLHNSPIQLIKFVIEKGASVHIFYQMNDDNRMIYYTTQRTSLLGI